MEVALVHSAHIRESWQQLGEFFRLRLLGCFADWPWSYLAAQRLLARLRTSVQNRLAERRIELLALPTAPTVAPLLGQWTPQASWLTSPFNALGWPAISLPVGSDAKGLPIGLQLVGGPWREDNVLTTAAVVEEATRVAW